MTLIIGIFTRDVHENKEIIFASDGLAIIEENDKLKRLKEDAEKIKKLTPKICMGYAGKNPELFEEVFDELNCRTPIKIKKDADAFCKRLEELILKILNTKKYSEIEEDLKKKNQLYRKFIVGGVFHNKLMLIRANPEDNYKVLKKEVAYAFPIYHYNIAGSTDEIQEEVDFIINKKLKGIEIMNWDEIEAIIRETISEIALKHPDKINNHIFIRRLSNRFDLKKYKGMT